MIKTDKIYFAYPGTGQTPDVLKEIDISIKSGEFVAILGHNGSGKSTLARHLNALLMPTQGTLWINGKDTKERENLWTIRQTVGMVFQNPDNQIIATVVEEDVAFGPENLGVSPAEIRQRVDETLATVGMESFALSAPHNLSGGQKQRVAIAGVLAMRPDCIVLDEPTAMLDPAGRREVLETVTRLNQEGITVILITHFMEEAVLAKRVIVMHDGEVVLDDTPRGVFSQVETMREYVLSVPPVTALAHKLRESGLDVAEDIMTVEEFVQDTAIQKALTTPSPSVIPGLTQVAGVSSKNDLLLRPAQDSITISTVGGIPSQGRDDREKVVTQIKNLTHTYSPGSVFEMTALNDINLSINQGEMVALIGHTGSGKSTLIQHLNGLLKPTSGQILIEGEDIAADKTKLKALRQKVGLVFQYPEHQLFEPTVYKDVAFGPTRMGLTPEEIESQTKKSLTTVGLGEEFYEKSPFELSGGEKRRAAIAGVLAMGPKILILDEPTAGLDPQGRREILAQIKKMHTELGITVILVSHSMDDAARLTDRIIVLNQGNLLYDDTPSQVFSQAETLLKIGLDIPQISRLAARLGELNPAIPSNIFTIDALADCILGVAK
ncbi:MAG: energy-coupling factor transporter ATPase [Defluviitaleaceae bacterium]|nr:energy-coupling factor transporter ATPase [Defluviitaleaceae bacterium]